MQQPVLSPGWEAAAHALVAQALRLSEWERVRVAAELLTRVEGPLDDVSDDEWLANSIGGRIPCGAARVSITPGLSCGT